MKPHRFVVLARKVRGFDTREDADEFARANYPAVICERMERGGQSVLVEVARHDFLFDAERGQWRIMMG